MSGKTIGEASIRIGADGTNFTSEVKAEASKGGLTAGKAFLANLAANLTSSAISKITGSIWNGMTSAFKGGFDRLMNIEQAEAKLRALGIDVEAAMDSVSASVDGTRFAISDAADMAATLGASGVKAGDDMTRWLTLTANSAEFMGVEFSEAQRILQKVAQSGRVTGETFEQLPIAVSALADHLGVSQEEVRKLASQGKISANDFRDAMEGTLGPMAAEVGQTFSAMVANIRTAINAGAANLLGPIIEAIKPLLPELLAWVKGVRDAMKPIGEAIGEAIVPAVELLMSLLTGEGPKVSGVFLEIRDTVSNALGVASDAVSAFVEGLGGFDAIKELAGPLLSLATGPLGILKTALLDVFSGSGGVDIVGFASSFGSSLKPVVGAVAQLADVLISSLSSALTTIIPLVIEVGGVLLTMAGEILTQLVPVLANVAQAVLPILAGAIESIVPAVLGLIESLAPLVVMLIESLMPAVMQIVTGVMPPLVAVLEAVITTVVAVVSAVLPLVSTLLDLLIPVITNLVSTILPPLIETFALIAEVLTTTVLPILTAVATFLVDVLGAAIEWLSPLVETVFNFIAETISNAMTLVQGIINTVMGIVTGDWSRAWDGIKQIATSLWNQIKNMVSTVINAIRGVITSVLGAISGTWSTIWNSVKSTATSVWNGIKSSISGIIDGVKSKISSTLDSIKSAMSNAWESARTTTQNAWNRIKNAVTNTITVLLIEVKGLPGRIINALGNLGTLLWNAGKDVIRGLINGIKSMGSALWDAVKRLVSENIPGPIKRVLGISSPSKVAAELGRNTVEGLEVGMFQEFRGLSQRVAREANRLAEAAVPAFPARALAAPLGNLAVETPALQRAAVVASTGTGGAGGNTYHVAVNLNMDDLEGLRTLEDFLEMIEVRTRMAQGV